MTIRISQKTLERLEWPRILVLLRSESARRPAAHAEGNADFRERELGIGAALAAPGEGGDNATVVRRC